MSPSLPRLVPVLLATAVALPATLGAAFLDPPESPVTLQDADEPAAPPRLAAVALVTRNFDAMLPFYRDVMGFTLRSLDEEHRFAELANEGVVFNLTTPEAMKFASGTARFDEPARGQAFELAFEVATPEAVDATFRRLTQKGARPVAAPADKPWGQRMAFFADPDGNVHDVYARR